MANPSYGLWPPGDAGGGAPTPLAIVQLRLGAGTEAIDGQIGTLVTGINVNGTGDYELTLDPAAGIADPSKLFWTIGAGDFTAKFAVGFPTLPTFALNVYDAAGAHAAIGRVCIAFWYDAT